MGRLELPILRVSKLAHRRAKDLVTRVPEEFEEPRVHLQPLPLRRDQGQADVGRLERFSEHLIAPRHGRPAGGLRARLGRPRAAPNQQPREHGPDQSGKERV